MLGFFDDHRHTAYREFVVNRTAALDEPDFLSGRSLRPRYRPRDHPGPRP
ncbi:MAG TPA: hypothetical protein VHO07_17345 [Streptosporangiaceae bacterium]|jgi:hypothetical protein|nr:hypothetical protein [Streptosporangiaceae bacterium]